MTKRLVPVLLLLSVQFVCFHVASHGQEGARDDENLIRGLIRDKLYGVAADRIFEFVFKYPGHPRRERMLFEICDLLVKNGNEPKAVPLLRCYLQEFPNGRRQKAISLMLARGHIAVGEYATAVDLLEGILEDSGYSSADHTTARLLLARQYLVQQRFEDAAALLQRSIARGSSAEARLLYARALKGSGRLDGAERMLQRILAAVKRGEIWEEARAELASVYVQSARYQDCVQLLADWEPKNEGSLTNGEKELLLAKAVSLYHLGDYEKAYNALLPLLEEIKDSVGLEEQLPWVLLALEEWKSLAEILRNEFSRSEDTVQRRFWGELLVLSYVNSSRSGEAVKILEVLAQEESDPDKKAEFLIQASQITPDTKAGMELLEKAIGEKPSNPILGKAVYLKALAHEEAGRRQEALDVFSDLEKIRHSGVDASDISLRKGRIYFSRGDWGSAEAEFRSAIEVNTVSPAGLDAYPILLRCLVLLRRPREAAEVFEEYKERIPALPIPSAAWRDAAAAYAMERDGRMAVYAAEKAVTNAERATNNNLEQLLLSLANRAKAADELDLAEAVYNRLLELSEGRIEQAALAGLADCALKNERWQDAIESCRHLVIVAAGSWTARWAEFTMAGCLDKLGRTLERDALLTTLAEAEPKDAFSYAAVEELQRLALESNRFDSALRAVPQFNALNPVRQHNMHRLLTQAQRAYLTGRTKDAVELYKTYPPALKMPLLHRFIFAEALFETEDLSGANEILSSLETSRLLPPQRWRSQQIMAEALLSAGESEAAVTLFNGLLDRPLPADRRLQVIYGLARAEEVVGKWQEAQSHYQLYLEEAKSAEPDMAVLRQIAESFAAHGDLRSASLLFRRLELLAEKTEDAVGFRFRALEMQEQAGEEDQAAEEYLKIAYQHADLVPWPAKARMRAAAIFEKQKRLEAAQRQYEVVAERYPNTDEGREAAKKLRALRQRRNLIQEEQIKTP